MTPPTVQAAAVPHGKNGTAAGAVSRTPRVFSVRRDWILFGCLVFLFEFGFAVYNGVFQNFLRDVLHAGPLQLGTLESLREIPGLLAALTAGTLVALAETRVGGLGLILTAVGIGATGLVPSYSKLILVPVFWSIGFHLWSSVSPAIILALAKGLEGGRHLGRMASIGSAAGLCGLALSYGLAHFHPAYRTYFFIAAGCIGMAGILCTRLSAHAAGAPRERIILRREYGLYYLLSFLEGCRRQIFAIFATFALILVYRLPLHSMLGLQLANAILILITAPLVGRLIDRHGERSTLTFYSAALIAVFLGYATFHNALALCALYLIDNVLFSFGMGFTTYLNRIVRPGELTPCLAMGTTMNHVAAVIVPVGGAWLWHYSDNYQLPFWVGVGVAAVSLFATQRLSGHPSRDERSPAA
jgi:MFS family permease